MRERASQWDASTMISEDNTFLTEGSSASGGTALRAKKRGEVENQPPFNNQSKMQWKSDTQVTAESIA
eukprot:m.5856 g.5856  ORF g.5856 m.5856 type:complete len:68 (+) comp3421_c0_seq1:928-1131(+)